MKIFAVIMAGGVGSRLWPKSREASPKQLLHILGDGTMIQNTVARLQPMVPFQDIFIVTNRSQVEAIHQQTPQIPRENIIAEPFGRNTAPCVALAATILRDRDPEGVMVVLPADHWIQNVGEFQQKLRLACEAAQEMRCLVTMGIAPTRPETGYGYIQWLDRADQANRFFEQGLRPVKTFAEKPDLTTAQEFLESGDFLWNSGMFAWRVDTIIEEFQQHLPELMEQAESIHAAIGSDYYADQLENIYGQIAPISIDYGIMEKSRRVYVTQCEFGWSDVGSWDETYRLSRKDNNGNSIVGDVITIDTSNSFIRTAGKMIATVGIKDLIVIDTDDALLICHRGDSQRVQGVVDYLRRKKISSLL
ncbi:MAG: mannose-1-phosphate guanylyltransferase [Chlorobi bacterium]|nr:mannose-1-phosphate guanylyltransferase [Chlorobiota bacterium]MBX7217530.1 mannose-1-phosphate guanylyltransferase [Candidatus Kapabacteria bacterium]